MRGFKLVRKIANGYESFFHFIYQLGEKNVGQGFYVWPDKETAMRCLSLLRTKRADRWLELYGYPIEEVVLTEVEYDKVLEQYWEWDNKDFLALRVENLTILHEEELPSHLFNQMN